MPGYWHPHSEFQEWLEQKLLFFLPMFESQIRLYADILEKIYIRAPSFGLRPLFSYRQARKVSIGNILRDDSFMSQLANSKRLCCWTGLTPGNNESADKKKSVRITHAGVYLKPALVQVVHAAVKSDKAPYYKSSMNAFLNGEEKKRTIIAITGTILTAIYNMFVTGKIWNPSDLYKINMPQEMMEMQKQKAIKQAAKLLISLGLIKEIDISMA